MIHLLICIDDTDNLESVGTGELADDMAQMIENNGWGNATRVTRHQLFIHEDIPYTSHNSSMCFEANIEEKYFNIMKDAFIDFLIINHAEGSDPGLCIVNLSTFENHEELISYGKKAKVEVLNKEIAYDFAKKYGIHLSEHGGTGLGVIGSLAGCGLRLSGSDGRVRGKEAVPQGAILVKDLLEVPHLESVQRVTAEELSQAETVHIEGQVKLVYLDHKFTLLVEEKQALTEKVWVNLPKPKLKNY